MKVTVKLFGIREKVLDNPLKAVALKDGSIVRDLFECLDIDENDVGILMINSRSATFDQILYNKDVVTMISVIGGG